MATSNYQESLTFMTNAEPDDFTQQGFYLKVKGFLDHSQNWSEEEKNTFIKEMLRTFEYVNGWDYIHAEAPVSIFGFTQSDNSQSVLNCFALVCETFPDVEESARVQYIIDEVARVKTHQNAPIYRYHENKKLNTIFRDGALKLAVVKELMFRRDLLKPKLDRTLFINESRFCLSNPYSSFPEREMLSYLLKLDIPQYFLNQIRTLTIIQECIYLYEELPWSFKFCWLSLGKMAVLDLDLLPNLECVIIKENDNSKGFWVKESVELDRYGNKRGNAIEETLLPQNFVQALNERGISIIQEKLKSTRIKTSFSRGGLPPSIETSFVEIL